MPNGAGPDAAWLPAVLGGGLTAKTTAGAAVDGACSNSVVQLALGRTGPPAACAPAAGRAASPALSTQISEEASGPGAFIEGAGDGVPRLPLVLRPDRSDLNQGRKS